MDRQAARVADVGDVVEQLQRVDELAPGLGAALQLEADQAAVAALQVGVGAPLRLAGHAAPGWITLVDLGVLREMVGHGGGVAAVLAHAQRQGLQPLDEHGRR